MVIRQDDGTDAVYTGPVVQISASSDVIEAGTSTEVTVTCSDHSGDPLDLMRVRISASSGSCTPAEAITDMYGSCDFEYGAPSSIPGPTTVTIAAVMENGLFDVSVEKILTVTYRLSGEIIGPNIVLVNSPDVVCNIHVTAGGRPVPDVSLNPTVLGSGTHVSHDTATNSSGDAQLVVRPSSSTTGSISIIVQANKANYLSTSLAKGISVSRTLDPMVLTITSDQPSCKRWGSRLLTATVMRGGTPEPGAALSWSADKGDMYPASTISASNGTSCSYLTASGVEGGAIKVNVTVAANAEVVYREISISVEPVDAWIKPYIKSPSGTYPLLVTPTTYAMVPRILEQRQYFPGEEMVLDTYAESDVRSDPVHRVRSWFVLEDPLQREVVRIDLGTSSSKDEHLFDFGPQSVFTIPDMPFVGNYTCKFVLTDPRSVHIYNITEVRDPVQVFREGGDDWTLMYYFAGDNNLADWMDTEIARLEDEGTGGKFDVYVFYDRCESVYDNLDGTMEWTGTKRFDLDRGLAHAEEYPSPQDSGDKQVLLSFMMWAADCSPAGHYCLVLSDHGAAQEGVCFQDTSSPRDNLVLDDLDYTLGGFSAARRMTDVLVFSACHMASLEVAAHTREHTRYQVFSQKVMWTLHAFVCPDALERLKNDHDWASAGPSPVAVARDFMNGFNDVAGGTSYDCPVSIMNSALVGDLVNALDDMCRIIYYNWDLLGDSMSEAFEEMWRTGGPYAEQTNLADLKGFVEIVREGLSEYIMTLPGRSAYEAADEFMDSFDETILAFLPMADYHGLNIFLPNSRPILNYADKFVDLNSDQDNWFKCLRAIYTGQGGVVDPIEDHPLQAGTAYTIDGDSDGLNDGFGFSIGTNGISFGHGWSAVVTMSKLVTTGGGDLPNGSLTFMRVVPLEGVISGLRINLTAPTNGSYIIHLRSVDQDGNVVQEVNIANVSLEGSPGKGSAPVLDLTWPDGVVKAGDEVPFLASASDPDGDPVELWWDMDLSDGLGLDGAGNSINWTYALGGNTSVLCVASDGSHLVVKEIPIHIIEPEVNRDPVANMTWSQPRGLVVRFDASALSTDPDGDQLQYRFNFGDGNMTGWMDDPIVEHEYPWSGIFAASLKVRDRRGGESDRSFHDMELFEIPNRSPVLAIPDGVEMIERGSSFTLWLNGSHDPDQDHLTVIVSWGDGSSETFVFDGTIDRPMNHTYGRDGRYTIDVSVSDGTTNATSGELDVRVSDDKDDGVFDPLLVILIVAVLVIIVALFAIVAISAILFTRSRRGKDEE